MVYWNWHGFGGAMSLARFDVSEIVNLRRVRKTMARHQAEVEAGENRIRFGLTKAERQAQAARREHAERQHEGHALTKRDAK